MKTSWAKARVLDASDRSYLDTVLPLFEGAKKEIVLSLYLVEPQDQAGPEHPANRLMEALIRACERGVQVRIFLNTNFRFRPKTEVGRGRYFEKLIQKGAELTALLPNRRLHDKLIVIDGRFVVDGSTNWSLSALQSNFESTSVIDSPAHARKKLERIKGLSEPSPTKKARDTDEPLLPIPETVRFPKVLMERNFLPRMVRTSNERTLDLYLLLLGQAEAGGKDELDLDLEVAGKALGLASEWDRVQIRRQMIKVLKKLQVHYGLINVELRYGRNPHVKMKNLPGERIEIPGRLLDPVFLSRQSPGTVILALAEEVLKKEGTPIDSLSASELEKRFGVGRNVFARARKISSNDLK